MPEMMIVTSAFIAEIGYNPADQAALVRTKNGNVYRVPMNQDQYEEFRAAESIGKHYNTHLRSKAVRVN
jgi:KTSC domain